MKYNTSLLSLLQKADRLKKGGDYEGAISVLQKVILEDAECIEAYEELGDNYLSLRKLDQAEKALQQALKFNDTSANAHYLLGFLYSLEQKWGLSTEELIIADEASPNNPEILRCLGWSIYNVNRATQGIALLERSQTLRPMDANILCDLGVCYLNNADFAKAEQIFKKVIRINPDSDQAKEAFRFLEILGRRLETR